MMSVKWNTWRQRISYSDGAIDLVTVTAISTLEGGKRTGLARQKLKRVSTIQGSRENLVKMDVSQRR
jgi:hypothetical protein